MKKERDMELTPLVSVVMPAYNAAQYVEETIRSVVAQTVTDWELIVVDDSSADDTCDLVERLAEEDSRIRLVKNAENSGVAMTRNRAMNMARGQYVAFLDSDDIWYPEKLEKQIALMKATCADIVYCSYAIINEDNEKQCSDFLVPEKTDLNAMLIKSVLSCSTVLLTREVVNQYRFSGDYYHEDYILWLRMLKDGKKAHGCTQVLAAYRIRRDSRASNKIRSAQRRWTIYRTYLRMSWIESAYYLTRYALSGVKKYWKAR